VRHGRVALTATALSRAILHDCCSFGETLFGKGDLECTGSQRITLQRYYVTSFPVENSSFSSVHFFGSLAGCVLLDFQPEPGDN
jgi:hypothetical protein